MTLVTRTRIELDFLLFAIYGNVEFYQVLCEIRGIDVLGFRVILHSFL